MADLHLRGRVFSTPSAVTALVDGVEVFSGQVGVGQSLDTDIELFEITDVTSGAVSISVTSGVVSIGLLATEETADPWNIKAEYFESYVAEYNGTTYMCKSNGTPVGTLPTDTTYWEPYVLPSPWLTGDVRADILINGSAPEWPATPVVPMPGGTPEDPDWYGWYFELGAGETITFNIDSTALL